MYDYILIGMSICIVVGFHSYRFLNSRILEYHAFLNMSDNKSRFNGCMSMSMWSMVLWLNVLHLRPSMKRVTQIIPMLHMREKSCARKNLNATCERKSTNLSSRVSIFFT